MSSNNLSGWIEYGKSRISDIFDDKGVLKEQSPFYYGYWIAAYEIKGEIKSISKEELLDILGQLELPGSGWPPFWIPTRKGIKPYLYYKELECLLYEGEQDPAHSDFWRASPDGKMFLIRGYYEDGIEEVKPGEIIDIIFPIRQVTEVFLHALELSKELANDISESEVEFYFEWTGLQNRKLEALDPRRYLSMERISRQPSVETNISVKVSDIRSALVSNVCKVSSELFSSFEFFTLSQSVVEEFIDKMMKWPKRKQIVF
jgi:transcriptional regulator with XRE-family HTH domain